MKAVRISFVNVPSRAASGDPAVPTQFAISAPLLEMDNYLFWFLLYHFPTFWPPSTKTWRRTRIGPFFAILRKT